MIFMCVRRRWRCAAVIANTQTLSTYTYLHIYLYIYGRWSSRRVSQWQKLFAITSLTRTPATLILGTTCGRLLSELGVTRTIYANLLAFEYLFIRERRRKQMEVERDGGRVTSAMAVCQYARSTVSCVVIWWMRGRTNTENRNMVVIVPSPESRTRLTTHRIRTTNKKKYACSDIDKLNKDNVRVITDDVVRVVLWLWDDRKLWKRETTQLLTSYCMINWSSRCMYHLCHGPRSYGPNAIDGIHSHLDVLAMAVENGIMSGFMEMREPRESN